jgi:hypothetical protein
LPPGLQMTPAGIISGTPLDLGHYTGTIKVTDAAKQQAFGVININPITPKASQDDDSEEPAKLLT